MAKLPATNVLLASVAAAGLYIIYTTYTNMGGGALSVERWVRSCWWGRGLALLGSIKSEGRMGYDPRFHHSNHSTHPRAA